MFKSFIPLILASFQLTSCGQGLESSAAKAEKELGIKVTVKSDDNDTCLLKQLESLLSDYKALDNFERNEFKRRLKSKYDNIVLNRSKFSGVIEGEGVFLALVERRYSNNRPYFVEIGNKLIGGELREQSENSRTLLSIEGRSLRITAQLLRDESLRRYYRTQKLVTYDTVESHDSELFINARKKGEIYLDKEIATPTQKCGANIKLNEI